MKRVIIALSTLAVTAFAQAKKDTYYADSYNVTVDWKQAEDIAKSVGKRVEDYEKVHKNITTESNKALAKAIAEAYKSTSDKIKSEFDKSVAPLIRDLDDVAEQLEINKECKMDCAVKCFKPNKWDTINSRFVLGFERDCFANCSCYFKFEKWTKKQKDEFEKEVKQPWEKVIRESDDFVEAVAKEARDKIVPALEEHARREQELEDKFNAMANDILVKDLGCNAACVNRCTNTYYSDFWSFSSCVAGCDCDEAEAVVEITQAKVKTYAQVKTAVRAQNFAQRFQSRGSL